MIPEIYHDRFWVSVYRLDSGLWRHRFMWSSDCRDEKDYVYVNALEIRDWCEPSVKPRVG